MTTRRETLLNYIAATLLPTPLGALAVPATVYRDRATALRREESPAVLVEALGDTADYEDIGFMTWTLQVRIAVITRGGAPQTLADPAVQAIHAAVMADRSLAASGVTVLDVLPVRVDFQTLDADQPAGLADCIYAVKYRTNPSDLTV